ncbi:hypothetical protein JW905_03090, partial [bacterium]|nr:hypothetical protein [candidate division CSSED10-310 bacterium]
NLVIIVVMHWRSILHGSQARLTFHWGRTRNLTMIVVVRWRSIFHSNHGDKDALLALLEHDKTR